jgi:hypothetical protein
MAINYKCAIFIFKNLTLVTRFYYYNETTETAVITNVITLSKPIQAIQLLCQRYLLKLNNIKL